MLNFDFGSVGRGNNAVFPPVIGMKVMNFIEGEPLMLEVRVGHNA